MLTDNEVFEKAVEKFGADEQLRMLQEECAELIAAINQFRRKRIPFNALAEELADVTVMLHQVPHIYGPDSVDHINRIIEMKVRRLALKLEGQ